MNNDIKEILDNPKILMLSYGNYISLDDYVKLKDYITNLQEENNEQKNIIVKQNDRIKGTIEYLNTNSLLNFEHSEEQNIDLITDTKTKEDLLNILQNK